MSQNPIVLPTTGTVSGLQLVQDANAALDTLNTKWAGSSPPSSPEPYQDWLDTSTSPPTLRIYDGAEWVAVGEVDTTNHVFLPMGLIPPGMVTPFAGAAAPSGWLLCYGQAISRTTYAALFAVVGTTYGAGDGSTTFNVPDMRGSLPMGLDNMGGTAANRVTEAVSGVASATLGGRGGDERLHAHSHGISDPGHVHQQRANDGGSNLDGNLHNPNSNQNGRYADCNTGSSVTGISIQNAGSGGAQNMPPVLALNYIIKT